MSDFSTSAPVTARQSLAGKSAIVTAGSRGIGRAIARRLGADGANVVVNYHRNAAAADEVVAAIAASGSKAVAVQADIGVRAEVEQLFATALSTFGGVDILVNNAGISTLGPTAELTEEQVDRMLAVNFKGTFFAMQQAARGLADGGRVINISTGYTRAPYPNVGAYSGTKAAVEQFAVSLSKELGPRGITVNTVSPGLTDTEGISPAVRPQLDSFVAMTPLGRLGQPADIADVVAFLASDDARWLTGQVIVAAGGLV